MQRTVIRPRVSVARVENHLEDLRERMTSDAYRANLLAGAHPPPKACGHARLRRAAAHFRSCVGCDDSHRVELLRKLDARTGGTGGNTAAEDYDEIQDGDAELAMELWAWTERHGFGVKSLHEYARPGTTPVA
jgi:hypothetical protein